MPESIRERRVLGKPGGRPFAGESAKGHGSGARRKPEAGWVAPRGPWRAAPAGGAVAG